MGPTPRGNPVVPTPDQLLNDDLFRLAIESSPNGVAIVAPAGSIVMANARLESEFGYEHDELIGHHIEVLVPESLRSVHALARSDYLTQAETRRIGVLEVFGRRKDGSQIPVQVGLSAILTSSGVYTLASVVNVSERIRVDDEHRHALEELVAFERLVGDIAGQVREPRSGRCR